MEVSVIIPTFNGAAKIPTLLHALSRQTMLPSEVIVIIDGSFDTTVEEVQAFTNRLDIKWVWQQNSGRSGAKNRGVLESDSQLLIFLDDDMEPEPNCVRKHVEFHSQRQGVILSGNALEYESPAKTDIQNYKAYLTHKWTEKYPDNPVRLTESELFFTSANCSMLRETFNSVGGFSAELSDSEDQEFAIRAMTKGEAVYFDRGNVAIHHDPITCKSYIRRQRQYRLAHQFLVDNYPGRFANRTLNVQTLRYQLKRIWFFLFSFSAWTEAVDEEKLFFLPRRFRYKLYDWIIQAQSVVFPKSY
jgi:glycosyltransferase involved in cell wall biosynthesis